MKSTLFAVTFLVLISLCSCISFWGAPPIPIEDQGCGIGADLGFFISSGFQERPFVWPTFTFDVRFRILRDLAIGATFAPYVVINEISPYCVYEYAIDGDRSISLLVSVPFDFGLTDAIPGHWESIRFEGGASYNWKVNTDNTFSISVAVDPQVSGGETMFGKEGLPLRIGISNSTNLVRLKDDFLVWQNRIVLWHLTTIGITSGIFIPISLAAN